MPNTSEAYRPCQVVHAKERLHKLASAIWHGYINSVAKAKSGILGNSIDCYHNSGVKYFSLWSRKNPLSISCRLTFLFSFLDFNEPNRKWKPLWWKRWKMWDQHFDVDGQLDTNAPSRNHEVPSKSSVPIFIGKLPCTVGVSPPTPNGGCKCIPPPHHHIPHLQVYLPHDSTSPTSIAGWEGQR